MNTTTTMNTTTKATTETAPRYIGTITEIKPLRACFALNGTKSFFLVRVSNPEFKGSPWAVATLKDDNSFQIDACWMRTEKIAYREFKSAERDTAYFLHEVPASVVRTLTY
jgi:hypothetical protein